MSIVTHLILATSLLMPVSAAALPQTCTDCDGNGVPEADEQTAASGLVAQYFRSQGAGNFTERLVARIDPDVQFNWGDGAPDPALPVNDFAVRWTGTLLVPATGLYTFSTRTDDGVRLWVNDALLINKWQPQSPTTWSATINLVAGTRVALRMDYYEAGGGAEAALNWIPPGGVLEPVPTAVLEPLLDLDGDGWPDACGDCNGNGVVDAQELRDGLATDCNGNCILDGCEIGQSATVGYWRFEETAGAGVADSSGNGLGGVASDITRSGEVVSRIVPATAADNNGSAALGTAGRVLVEDPSDILAFGASSFTIEAWVKLDAIAAGATAADRQIILQRKALASGDKFADYMLFAQGGDMPTVGVANDGRGCCFNGRELVLAFGNGGAASASFWTVTSNLRIEDTEWHFVSAAFDADAALVRFRLDDATETLACVDRGHVDVSGPLLIGMHTSAAGTFNQPLEGSIDEVRISAGFLPESLLLVRPDAADCNGNGLPDGCDIAGGSDADCDADGLPDDCERDCNRNGTPDDCDLAGGSSQDCNGDGVPDDCQLVDNDCDGNGVPDDCQLAGGDCNRNGVPDSCDLASGGFPDCNADGVIDGCQIGNPLDYRIDDGGAEFGVRAAGNRMAWMNQFRVEQGAAVIEEIDIMFVFAPAGQAVTVYVWSDPNGDGDPTDAQVLSALETTVGTLGVYRTLDIPDATVGPNGTSFFVGAITATTTADFPGPLDSSGAALSRRSWIVGSSSPIDPNNLSAGVEEFRTVEQALPFPGRWLVRARGTTTTNDCNGNGVPDGCDIADGTSADTDGSGVPDECEDCNANGTLDSIDITAGSSPDCNADGVPDECQLAGGDCNQDGIPDACQLTDNDCNGNGVPDECDVSSGTSADLDTSGVPDECEDCNGNDILDSADIATGFSPDCNADGVPDECQLGEPPLDIEYALDDGTRDGNLGFGAVADIYWLNQYTVAEGGETIAQIRVVLGNAFAGQPYRVGLWSDPNGDGQPNDAQLLATADAVVANGNTSVFNEVDVAPTFIGPAGTSFFAGVLYRDEFGNQFPLGVDNSFANQRTWVAAGPTVDPNDLGVAATYGYLARLNGLVRAFGFDGALPEDCNGNGVPDACDIADGTASDANGDGRPDCCDRPNGCTACVADLNRDGEVSAADIAILLSAWGTPDADLDGDGDTSAADITILLSAWGLCP